MQQEVISGINPGFPELSQSQGQVAHVLLTRSPLEYPRRGLSARLACVKHAASVRPEPGSNSPLNAKPRPHPRRSPAGNISTHTTRIHGYKTVRDTPEDAPRDGGLVQINALAFNTLLSSQETRAHQQPETNPPPGQLH